MNEVQGRSRILIVDPDELAARSYAASLTAAGHLVELRTAAYGTLPHVLRFRPQLVVVSTQLVGLDAASLAMLVQGRSGRDGPRVVFVSDDAPDVLAAAVAACNVAGAVHKSVPPPAMPMALDQAVRTGRVITA